MPTVSICLPVYNGANYLAQAIESALAQTFEDFEILIANDCSTDQTPEIIEKYQKRDSRIKSWTNPKNLKLFGNYNACIERSESKYVKLFAHDDLFHPQTLERMVSVLEEYPHVNLVSTARCWIDENGDRIEPDSEIAAKTMKPYQEDRFLKASEAISETLKEVINWLGEPSSQMFRKSGADGGYDTSFKQVGDLEYSYRLLQKGDYYYIADELCFFRSHAASWSTARALDITAYLDWFLLGAKYSKYLPQAGLTEEQYCLNVIKAISSNLETRMHEAGRLGAKEREKLLLELFANQSPLSFFVCSKGEPRNYERELKALGPMAFLQTAILENHLRQIHEELSKVYHQELERSEALIAVRPQIEEGIYGLKRALRRRDKQIRALRHAAQKISLRREQLSSKVSELEKDLANRDEEILVLQEALTSMGNSLSWKITEPLRKFRGN
jgi:glycosyltransferase involved in cell wall biosynthesis